MAILAYVWFRFEWQYGVGTILALIHDTVTTIGIYCSVRPGVQPHFDRGATDYCRLLLNDTVVIFDRVRENLRKYKTMPLSDLLDRSINETLARTMMTSLTTLLALVALVELRRPRDPRLHDSHDLGRADRHLLDGLHLDTGPGALLNLRRESGVPATQTP